MLERCGSISKPFKIITGNLNCHNTFYQFNHKTIMHSRCLIFSQYFRLFLVLMVTLILTSYNRIYSANNQGLEKDDQVDSRYHRLNKLFEVDDILRRHEDQLLVLSCYPY